MSISLPNFPHLRQVAPPAAPAPEPPPPRPRRRVTHPRQRHGGPRFLTDVIVELGFTERDRADAAVHAAREGATTPEDVLLGWGAITEDQLARAIAERNGLDHLDLSVFHVDMAAANLLSSTAAEALRGGAGRLHRRALASSSRWPTRPTSSRSTTSR